MSSTVACLDTTTPLATVQTALPLLKFRVVPVDGQYHVEINFNNSWQRTSVAHDNYHDAYGEVIAIINKKPYIKYYDFKQHSPVAQLV